MGNLGLMGTTQQFQVMSERNLKRKKKKKHIGTEKYFPCYFILTKELQRQACFQRGAAISRLRGYGFF